MKMGVNVIGVEDDDDDDDDNDDDAEDWVVNS